jgi:hypothetical protein
MDRNGSFRGRMALSDEDDGALASLGLPIVALRIELVGGS